ncbi:hypothetical protein H9P43_004295 [Blastocladiella emersonii ATCC 22665]|nr:hypothetical protein H9P43_004295 [Blastocladiella emersonii ATCC 22665]
MSAVQRALLLLVLVAALVNAQHEGHGGMPMASGSPAAAVPTASSTPAAGGMDHSGHGMGMGGMSSTGAAAAAPTNTSDPPMPDRAEAKLVASDKLTAYCQTAPKASAPCALWATCQANKNAPSAVCGTISLARAICTVDKDTTSKGAKELCAEYATVCTGTKCDGLGWPMFAPSAAFQAGIFGMCDAHAKMGETMAGCEKCAKPASGVPAATETDWTKLAGTCEAFDVYGTMCSSMPKMKDCALWRTMCSTVPNAATAFPKYCMGEAMAAANVKFNASAVMGAGGASATTSGSSSSATKTSASAGATGTAAAAGKSAAGTLSAPLAVQAVGTAAVVLAAAFLGM